MAYVYLRGHESDGRGFEALGVSLEAVGLLFLEAEGAKARICLFSVKISLPPDIKPVQG